MRILKLTRSKSNINNNSIKIRPKIKPKSIKRRCCGGKRK